MRKMVSLTRAQRMVFDHLCAFIRDNGYSPTFEELGKLCGYFSTSTTSKHLANLKRKGFIDFTPFCARTIVIRRGAEKGCCPLCGRGKLPAVSA